MVNRLGTAIPFRGQAAAIRPVPVVYLAKAALISPGNIQNSHTSKHPAIKMGLSKSVNVTLIGDGLGRMRLDI
jgi:hypothetical protein